MQHCELKHFIAHRMTLLNSSESLLSWDSWKDFCTLDVTRRKVLCTFSPSNLSLFADFVLTATTLYWYHDIMAILVQVSILYYSRKHLSNFWYASFLTKKPQPNSMLNKHVTTLTPIIFYLHFYQMSTDWKDLYYLPHIWSHLPSKNL